MNRDEFEAAVLELWTKTRVPLTRTNLLAHTKVGRGKLDRWLDEMVSADLLELDSDDEGELIWIVRGSKRPTFGPETLAEVDRKKRLSNEVDRLASGANLALRAAGLTKPAHPEKKSLLASGILSFIFGPLGWLYAAPLREAIPAIVIYLLLCKFLPVFILVYILGLINVTSAIGGILYAWSYNQEGKRSRLFGKPLKRLKKKVPRLRISSEE